MLIEAAGKLCGECKHFYPDTSKNPNGEGDCLNKNSSGVLKTHRLLTPAEAMLRNKSSKGNIIWAALYKEGIFDSCFEKDPEKKVVLQVGNEI